MYSVQNCNNKLYYLCCVNFILRIGIAVYDSRYVRNMVNILYKKVGNSNFYLLSMCLCYII